LIVDISPGVYDQAASCATGISGLTILDEIGCDQPESYASFEFVE
jgi:hypothetical protein